MQGAQRLQPGAAGRLALLIAGTIAAFALIAAAELVTVPDEKTTDAATRRILLGAQNAAPYGYLLLNVLGWYGLRGAVARWIRPWARALAGLLIVSVVFFFGLEFGVIPQEIVTIALDLTLLLISGVVGLVAVLVSIVDTLIGGVGPTPPVAGPPTIPTGGPPGGVVASGR